MGVVVGGDVVATSCPPTNDDANLPPLEWRQHEQPPSLDQITISRRHGISLPVPSQAARASSSCSLSIVRSRISFLPLFAKT